MGNNSEKKINVKIHDGFEDKELNLKGDLAIVLTSNHCDGSEKVLVGSASAIDLVLLYTSIYKVILPELKEIVCREIPEEVFNKIIETSEIKAFEMDGNKEISEFLRKM